MAVQVDRNVLALLTGQFHKTIFCHGQHAAGAAGPVVQEIRTGFDPVGYGNQDQLCHEPHHVTWGEVLTGLLVILFIKTTDEFLEDRAHTVIVQGGQSLGRRTHHQLR